MSSCKPAGRSSSRFAAALSVVGLMLVGCNEPESDGPATVTIPTAEERYERIVDILQQQVAGRSLTDTSAVNDFGSVAGMPVTDGRVRLQEEMIPPEKEGEPYRAVICLSTRSTVTVVLPQDDESDKAAEKAATQSRVEDAKAGLEEVSDMESLVVPKGDSLRRSLSKSPIHEIESDESKSCFPLEFRGDRWELANPIDEDEDELFSLAIEYALKMQ